MAILLLSSGLRAEDRMVPTGGLMTNQSIGAAVTAVTPLPEATLPGTEHKRTFVLVLGIVALAITFQQALANRKSLL
ncbi:MAG: hypothetical protein RL693_1741 [Verrucomicrobiota bacterium]